MQESIEVKCSRCNKTEFVMDEKRGEVICENCGLVLRDNVIDKGQEWRAFTREEQLKKKRVGSPITYSKYDKGLSTNINVGRDAYGRSLPPKKRRAFYRMRRLNIRSKLDSKNRNLLKAMAELNKLKSKIHVPRSVIEKAALLYRKALDEGIVRGRSISSLAAASLYAACRLTGVPRSLHEFAEKTRLKKKDVARAYRILIRTLRLKVPLDKSSKYVSKIASTVELEMKTEFKAIQILKEARKKKATVGKSPRGVAAAALYISSQLNGDEVTQRDLALAAGVTEVTVRNRYKELAEDLDMKL